MSHDPVHCNNMPSWWKMREFHFIVSLRTTVIHHKGNISCVAYNKYFKIPTHCVATKKVVTAALVGHLKIVAMVINNCGSVQKRYENCCLW